MISCNVSRQFHGLSQTLHDNFTVFHWSYARFLEAIFWEREDCFRLHPPVLRYGGAQERLGRVDESRATTSTHTALCSRPGETKGPLEAVSIHYRSTSLPRFVAVAGEVPKRKGQAPQPRSQHRSTSTALPPTQSRQVQRIAFNGDRVGG